MRLIGSRQVKRRLSEHTHVSRPPSVSPPLMAINTFEKRDWDRLKSTTGIVLATCGNMTGAVSLLLSLLWGRFFCFSISEDSKLGIGISKTGFYWQPQLFKLGRADERFPCCQLSLWTCKDIYYCLLVQCDSKYATIQNNIAMWVFSPFWCRRYLQSNYNFLLC